jgi:hypothetical protein
MGVKELIYKIGVAQQRVIYKSNCFGRLVTYIVVISFQSPQQFMEAIPPYHEGNQ